MANTVIQLKKSDVPNHIPAPIHLANGELAINYADGRLFYKDAAGAVQQISSGSNSFSTINVAGSLLTAAVRNSILTINQGDNIIFSTDIINDSFSISANLTPVFQIANAAFDYANTLSGGIDITAVYNEANAAYTVANAAFNAANNAVTDFSPAFNRANSAFDKANSANVLAYNTGIGANSYTNISVESANNYAGLMANAANSYAASLTPDLTAANNYAGVMANSANAYAGSVGISANNYAGYMANAANAYAASLTPDLSPAFNKANAAYTIANSAFDYANGIGTYESASYTVANAAFDKANSANALAYNTGIGANAYTNSVSISSNNYAGYMANAANAYAASLTPDLSPAFNKANSAYTVANASFDKANNALANVSGTVFNGNLIVSNAVIVGQTTLANGSITLPSGGSITEDNPLSMSITAPYQFAFRTGGGSYQWTFTNNGILGLSGGGLEFSDATVQTTAYTSTVYDTANASFDKANAANLLAYNTGIGANAYAVSVGASGNAYANLIGTSGNSYTDLSTASSNNHSGAMVNSANAYASATYFPYTGGTVTGDVSVSGNLTVKGTTLYANVQKLLVGDNIVVLNAELPSGSAPLGVNSGLSINRGTSSNTYLVWDESATKWAFTNDGSKELYIASNTDIESSNNYSGQMANSSNGYATTVGISGNVYANLIGTSGNSYTNLSTSSANNYAGYLSNTVYGYVNTSMTIANAAFDNSNTSYNLTNATYTAVNSAFGVINTAFTTANNALANNSGSVFNGDLIITGSVTVGSSKLTNFTLTTSSNNDQILDHFQTTSYRSAHYTITIDAGVEWETTQISLIHNSTDTFITEYGLLYTSNILATFSASVTLGEVRLNVVPKYASSTIRVLRTTLDD